MSVLSLRQLGFVLHITPAYFIKTAAETISFGQRTNSCMYQSEGKVVTRCNIAFLTQH